MHSALRKISVTYAFEIKSNVLHVDVTKIDSFHIVSAHAPNCLVPRYLREITLQGATFLRLHTRYIMKYGKDEKKNKFANKD